ncbi:MAG: RES family NAD+ phosphorylase [Vicinamibacterales bacterium]
MEIFRVFDWDGTSRGRSPGGPLFVPRLRQGAGRHDAPEKYGAWYGSRSAVSAVAESIQFLRGHALADSDFQRAGGANKALVGLWLDDALRLVDLDDPSQLAARHLRPSQVATLRRTVTQRIAVSMFDEGAGGLSWWSILEAEWTNMTLFYERALPYVSVMGPPRRLAIRLPEVQQAAELLGIQL